MKKKLLLRGVAKGGNTDAAGVGNTPKDAHGCAQKYGRGVLWEKIGGENATVFGKGVWKNDFFWGDSRATCG